MEDVSRSEVLGLFRLAINQPDRPETRNLAPHWLFPRNAAFAFAPANTFVRTCRRQLGKNRLKTCAGQSAGGVYSGLELDYNLPFAGQFCKERRKQRLCICLARFDVPHLGCSLPYEHNLDVWAEADWR